MRPFLALSKLAIICALIWFIQDRISFKDAVSVAHSTDIAIALLAATGVAIFQIIIYALRLRICLRILGYRVSLSSSGITTLLGGIFAYTPISFVSSDAARVWHLAGCNLSLIDSTKSVILDRMLGFVGMVCMTLVTAPFMIGAMEESPHLLGYTILIAGALIVTIGFFWASHVPPSLYRGTKLEKIAEFASISVHLTKHMRLTTTALFLSIMANLLNAIGIWSISAIYNYDVNLYIALVASPTIFLVAMMPLSFGGWGLREGVAVVALGIFGVSSIQALAISVTLGIALIIAYSPGLILFLIIRRRGKLFSLNASN